MRLLFYLLAAFLPTVAIYFTLVSLFGPMIPDDAGALQYWQGGRWLLAPIGGLVSAHLHRYVLAAGDANLLWCVLTVPALVGAVYSLAIPSPLWSFLVALTSVPFTFGLGAITVIILSLIAKRAFPQPENLVGSEFERLLLSLAMGAVASASTLSPFLGGREYLDDHVLFDDSLPERMTFILLFAFTGLSTYVMTRGFPRKSYGVRFVVLNLAWCAGIFLYLGWIALGQHLQMGEAGLVAWPLLLVVPALTPFVFLLCFFIVLPATLILASRPWQLLTMDHNRKQTANVEGSDAQADREPY